MGRCPLHEAPGDSLGRCNGHGRDARERDGMSDTTLFVTAIALIVLAIYVGRPRSPMVTGPAGALSEPQKLFAGNADMNNACPPGMIATMGKGVRRCIPDYPSGCPEGMLC